MKRSAILFLVAAAAGALLLTSCLPFFSVSQTEISFDGSGHVTETVIYTDYAGSSVYVTTYSTDGTYERIQKQYNVSSWAQYAGAKGTYSYDTGTKILTVNYTNFWSPGFGNSYVALTSSSVGIPKTITQPALFGSNNLFMLLTGSDGSYALAANNTYWDASSAKMNVNVVIASDLSTATATNESESFNPSNTAVSGSKYMDVYTIDAIYPSGIKALSDAKGKTITYTYLKDVYTPYTWIAGTTNYTTGTTTTYNGAGSESFFVASDLSYIGMIPSPLVFERSLAIK
jgi:hypothetical protein